MLVGGPDVWEVIRAVRSARGAEPDLDTEAVVAQIAAELLKRGHDVVAVAADPGLVGLPDEQVVGALVVALDKAIAAGEVSGPDEVGWLAPP